MPAVVDRGKLLDAALRVFGEHGYRGATTRRIADEAGVNEVTIFRQFGSKDALIHEAIRSRVIGGTDARLPATPADPARELTAWGQAVARNLWEQRAVLRQAIAEQFQHPAWAPTGIDHGRDALTDYLRRLAPPVSDDELRAAVGMLSGALFFEAMMRDLEPDAFLKSLDDAVADYVRVFCRALGLVP